MRKVLSKITAICILGLALIPINEVRADSWPYPSASLSAGAACVIDADTGAVLYDKNADEQYYPASITKLMTALLTLENCSLEEEVEISPDAVNNLERGAMTAGLSAGDTMDVENLLYALLLRSANDAANALAIHIAGSIPDFALLMNERAKELGCKHTDFKNPSGLTDSEHLTTAYDMTLIMRELLKNEDFLRIESADSFKLSPTIDYPGGLTVTMGHRMLRSSTSYSDDRVIAGKTGYITLSGNTLITAAAEGGRTVIVCVLKDVTPAHYEDTKNLIDFGLYNFTNVTVDDVLKRFNVEERLKADTVIGGKNDDIYMEGDITVTLPLKADTDAISARYEYNLHEGAPSSSIALLKLQYEGHTVGEGYIFNEPESQVGVESTGAGLSVKTKAAIGIGLVLAVIAGIALVLTGSLRYKALEEEKERKRRFEARKRRRLREMGISEEEFKRYIERTKRRSGRKS